MRSLASALALLTSACPSARTTEPAAPEAEETTVGSVGGETPDASISGDGRSARPADRAPTTLDELQYLVDLVTYAAGEHDLDAFVTKLGHVVNRDGGLLELTPVDPRFRSIRVRPYGQHVEEIGVSLATPVIGGDLILAFGPLHAVTVGDFWDEWRIYEVEVDVGRSYRVTVQTEQVPLATALENARLTELALFRWPRVEGANSPP